nr:hypothetical protein [Streptomyces sp. SID5468]
MKINDAGIANLCHAIKDASPKPVRPPAPPSVTEVGKSIYEALGPVAFLTRAVVEGRQTAIDGLIERLQHGNTMMSITDQALGAANPPKGPIT